MSEASTFLIQLFLAVLVGSTLIYYLRKKRERDAEAERLEEQTAFGNDLATQIATYLEGGLVIAFHHRDYCGVGLRFAEGRYIYAHVTDGELPTPTELAAWGWNSNERQEFTSREAFVSWLASQTTLALAGDHNQRLTRKRLLDAAAFCSKQPIERWSTYAG